LREAARDAQTSVTIIQKWLEEYGRYQPKRDVVEVVMKSEQDQIAALKQALAAPKLDSQRRSQCGWIKLVRISGSSW